MEQTAFNLGIADVRAAAERLRGYAVQTPLLQSPALNAATGARIYIKPENLQRTGSFKFRGAFNRLVQLSEEERNKGVLAWSSGNHAQGLAAAAQILSVPATIVMPEDAPRVKVDKTRAYGAEVISYDRYRESREEIGRRIAKARDLIIVPPYDDRDIIAGQGTVGLEFVQQMEGLGESLDSLLVCCGGGGLIAGVSTACPDTQVYAVEPSTFNDHERSLKSGRREQNAPHGTSICDALLAPTPGELTFAINLRTLAGALSVTDAQVRAAVRFAFDTLKLVVEPGGAVALAAILADAFDAKGKNIGIILSGGNIDPGLFTDIVQQANAQRK